MATIQRQSYKSGKLRYQVRISPQGHTPHFETFDRFSEAKSWATQGGGNPRLGWHDWSGRWLLALFAVA